MDVVPNTQKASYGLLLNANPTKTNVANTQAIGLASTSVVLSTADTAYVIEATLASSTDAFTVNLASGLAATSDTPVSQVETATAAGTITLTGNASVVVTGARITGSPLTIPVAVTNGDTAATWAGKVRTALNATAAITSVYTVGGSTTAISLTETTAANNDGTLNIALDNGTCTGITPAASSANTTAGVGGVVFLKNTGDGKDFEGITIPTVSNILGVLIRVTGGAASFVDISGNTLFIGGTTEAPGIALLVNSVGGVLFVSTLTVTATVGNAHVEINILAS